MKRDCMADLIRWKKEDSGRCFLLTGMRGTGKTYLTCEFAKSFYEGYIYLDFEHDARLRDTFNSNTEEIDFFDYIAEYLDSENLYIENVVYIFDEIQACSIALKLFTDSKHLVDFSIHCILNASYYTVALHQLSDSFRPSCKSCLYPLNFSEYLSAIGSEWYADVIRAHYSSNRKIPDIVHREMLSVFDDYLQIGGMPAAINEYLSTDIFDNLHEIQSNILWSCLRGLEKYCDESLYLKVIQIMKSLTSQWQKNNHKFRFTLIRKGVTYAQYKDAIDVLTDHHILYRINKIDEREAEEEQSFRLYFSDVGLFRAVSSNSILNTAKGKDTIYKLTQEHYISQELFRKQKSVHYWESDSQAKLDFIMDTIFDKTCRYTPVELKLSDAARSRSLRIFKAKYKINRHIRISEQNFESNENCLNIPLYALFML